ncbi:MULTISPECIES: hypothetical protein [unclassified Pseudoalteromonas]|uniref:hypothetical protein n=1 Tax=unclassified Pseudoalteromonas TaxID=194690 RepID=UPI00386E546B
MLDDKKLWHDFIGGVSVDLAIADASSGIAWAGVSSLAGTAAVVAVGPILAVVIVSSAIALLAYNFIDTKTLTKKLATNLRIAESNAKNNLQKIHNNLRDASNMYEENPIKFMHNLFAIPYLKND